MSRINIRQYKKHPLNRPYPATYLMWSSLDPVQQEALRKWAVDTNEVLVQFYKEAGGAVCSAFRKVFEIELDESVLNIDHDTYDGFDLEQAISDGASLYVDGDVAV